MNGIEQIVFDILFYLRHIKIYILRLNRQLFTDIKTFYQYALVAFFTNEIQNLSLSYNSLV